MEQLHGLLVIDKPRGLSSAQCTSRLKRLGQKKIGHAGTLDPMAQGVLLVLLGHATKVSGHLMAGGSKTYVAEIEFGRTTDTWDDDGVTEKALSPDERAAVWSADGEDGAAFVGRMAAEVAGWVGVSRQTVPPYSAAKHQGRTLYSLARAGQPVPEKVKDIEILQAEILWIDFPRAAFRVTCGSGTYIRSLAHSLGIRMGCGAVLTKLVREYSHPFGLDNAVPLQAVLDNPLIVHERVLPVTAALPDWPVVAVDAAGEASVRNGMPLRAKVCHGGAWVAGIKAVLVSPSGAPLALVEGLVKPVAGVDTPVWAVLRGLWA